MTWKPGASVPVVNTATPADSATGDPIGVEPSLNCTVPPLDAPAGLTVAVKVTLWPGFDGDPDDVTVVVDASLLTATLAVTTAPPSPGADAPVDACTLNCPVAVESSDGVNRRPAAPCAIVMNAPFAIGVAPSCWNSVPLVMLVILKWPTTTPSDRRTIGCSHGSNDSRLIARRRSASRSSRRIASARISASNSMLRSRPVDLARYIAASASRSSSSPRW